MVAWEIAPGGTLLRRELHGCWGAGRNGALESSLKVQRVFLLSEPSAGEAFGSEFAVLAL